MAKNNRIIVISLGGTISSLSEKMTDDVYKSPSIHVESIIEKIPFNKNVKEQIQCLQFTSKKSQDLNFDDLKHLAQTIQKACDNFETKGIVVIQGTNCLEECAFFINLVVKTKKPIIFTGSFRPINSLMFDGLNNIYNAVQIINSETALGQGVLITFNDCIVNARDAGKINPSIIGNFSMNDCGNSGYIHGEQTYLLKKTLKKHTYLSEFDLNKIHEFPKIAVIYGHLGMDRIFLEKIIENKIDGIISAGVGKGYQPQPITELLIKASKNGTIVLRCSRSGQGLIKNDLYLDNENEFITGHTHTPQKAFILLSLAFSVTKDKIALQRIFDTY